MKAKDLMSRSVVAVEKDDRIESVLETMQKQRMSKLVVLERERIVGIITDGDIADELGAMKNAGVPPSHLHASSAMRRAFDKVAPDTERKDVLEKLRAPSSAGILPVCHDATCIGVITASDLLKLVESAKSVESIMTAKDLHVVQPSDRVIHARRLMMDHHVERLPVLDKGKLVGILGEGDIANGLAKFKAGVRDAHQGAALQRFLVEEVMQRQVVTIAPEATAKDAAQKMIQDDVGCLPVLRGERLAGILTRSDLLRLVAP